MSGDVIEQRVSKMPAGSGAEAPVELTIGARAKIARIHCDAIDAAMKDGELPFHRDHDGRRVATWDALTEWMRRPQTGGSAR